MKIIQKLFLVLFTLLICQYSLAATSQPHSNNNYRDTIPQVEPEYNGNRIIVKSIKVIRKKGESYKIEYKLVNNGRNKIKLGKPSLVPEDLIVEFDESLEENDLVAAKPSIIESIKNQSISIRPGQLIMRNKIKFTHQPILPTDRIVTEVEKVEPTEKIVKNEAPTMEKSEDKVIPQTKFDETIKEILEEVPLPHSELENPRTPSLSSESSEGVEAKETTLGETILVRENKPSNKLEIEDAESITETLPFKSSEETEIQEVKEITKEEVPSEEKLCPDLIIKKAEILKKNKRFVLVNITIKNIGNIPISLHGKSKKEMDNIAIQSHFTRSHHLTRGSIPIDITYLTKGNKDKKGMLVPGEFITQKLKIETSKITKFTPVLALTLNPFSKNPECNKINNVFFIDVAEKAPEAIEATPPSKSSSEQPPKEKVTALEN